MATDRKLLDYLPPYMQEYPEMIGIMGAEQHRIDSMWDSAEAAFADQFIQEATEYGVSRWESMLVINPKDTDTLPERKFRILTRLNQELPYTLRGLERSLTSLCGADGYEVTVHAAEYHIEIRLALGNKNNYADVESLLQKMIPANMTQYIQIMYNNHNVLAKFTHRHLAAYTYDSLRNEVLE